MGAPSKRELGEEFAAQEPLADETEREADPADPQNQGLVDELGIVARIISGAQPFNELQQRVIGHVFPKIFGHRGWGQIDARENIKRNHDKNEKY
ncbi:MAG: hypothetical protein CTY36_11270 [Methylocystis sp.]|nr:MAG: hypothetical protein CTY36_11270 [Methylocystis sp.]